MSPYLDSSSAPFLVSQKAHTSLQVPLPLSFFFLSFFFFFFCDATILCRIMILMPNLCEIPNRSLWNMASGVVSQMKEAKPLMGWILSLEKCNTKQWKWISHLLSLPSRCGSFCSPSNKVPCTAEHKLWATCVPIKQLVKLEPVL